MTGQGLELRVEGQIGLVELARPERSNCLTQGMWNDLGVALDKFRSEDNVRAILICAKGKSFCTGAELDELEIARSDAESLRSFLENGQRVCRKMETSPIPIVGAVQGLCLAGGLELVLACDVVFAAGSARFGDQHAKYGLFPGWGASQRLPALVGMKRAIDLMFSARWLDAETAEAWGLVNYLVQDEKLRGEAISYCEMLCQRSRPALAAMKRMAREGASENLEVRLNQEVLTATTLFVGGDVDEGLKAFKEKREPNFEE